MIFGLFLFGLGSCAKENESSKDELKSEKIESNITMEVQDFLAKLESRNFDSGNLRSGTDYTGQEAIQIIENSLNYQYGWGNEAYSDFDLMRDTIIFPKTGSGLTQSETATLYQDALDLVESHYASVIFTQKHVKLVDLYIVSETSQEIKIGIFNVVGALYVLPPASWDFQTGDDYWGSKGTCADQNVDIWISEEIGKHVTFNYSPQGPANWYYVDIETHTHLWEDYNNFYPISWSIECEVNNYDPNNVCPDIDCNTFGFDFWCITNVEGNAYTSAYGNYVSQYSQSIVKDFLFMDLRFTFGLDFCFHEYWTDFYGTSYGKKEYLVGPTRVPSDPNPEM